MSVINVHNEWDPLEEIIVGIADGARVPSVDGGLFAIDYAADLDEPSQVPTGPYPEQVVEEAGEDLDGLAELLKSHGVTVRRPDFLDLSREFGTPDWSSDGYYNYCPRDVLLPIGNTIIEAPMVLRSRYFDAFSYRRLLLEYFDGGAQWISAPKPRLPDETYNVRPESGSILNDLEPIFDAANVLRIGRDILYQVSCSGNRYGMRWLERVLGDEYRMHPIASVYEGTHLDTTITPVRPGLVVICPERMHEDQVPRIFKNWDVIWCPPMIDSGWHGPFPRGSIWMGMNFIMLDPETAVVGEDQLPLIKELGRHGITTAPVRMRHARTLSGGIHCVTADIRRRGTLEDYC